MATRREGKGQSTSKILLSMLLSLSSFRFATSPQGLGTTVGDFRVEQPWERQEEEEEEENEKREEKVSVWEVVAWRRWKWAVGP